MVAVLTVAAPRAPRLSQDRESFKREEDLECLRGKIRLVYRMAAHNGKEYIVLGEFTGTGPCGVVQTRLLMVQQALWDAEPTIAPLAKWPRRCDLSYERRNSRAGSEKLPSRFMIGTRHLAAIS